MARRTRSDTEDLACALLCFEGGVTASLTASRIAQNKVRQLEITHDKSTISVDLLRQGVTFYKTGRSEYRSHAKVRYRQSGVIEIPFLEQRGEPLRVQLDHFVDCVLSGQQPRSAARTASTRWTRPSGWPRPPASTREPRSVPLSALDRNSGHVFREGQAAVR
jgi:predicted dehydrogenase